MTLQQLRFCDTDQLGHVNNAVYAVLYEAGRVELFVQAGMIGADPAYAPVIARLEVDFLREMNWPGEARVETALHRISTKSMHLRQRLLLGGELVSRASSVLAMIDVATRRAVPLTDAWRDALGQWLAPEFS